MIKLYSLTIRCLRCGCCFEPECSDFEAENDYDDRQMGTQIGYHWECELQCPDCRVEDTVNVNAWEYPEGIKNYDEIISTDIFDVTDWNVDVVGEGDDFDIAEEIEDECADYALDESPVFISDMQEFIDGSLKRMYEDFVDGISSQTPLTNGKCDLYFTFEKGSQDEIEYSKRKHRCLYLLRYFYSYLIEYWHLYTQISLESYKIFSIGCGCLLDLYGFLCSQKETFFEYHGIDVEDWEYRDLIPNLGPNVVFENKSLLHCLSDFQQDNLNETLGKFNVFIFPKTIEYLENDQRNDVTVLAQYVNQTIFKENTIYLILNGMEDYFEKDVERLDVLKNAFISNGFHVEKELTKSNLLPNSFYELSNWKKFPDDIKHFLSNVCEKCCVAGCSASNKPNRAPILSVNHFKYKIIKLVKDDSQCK